MIVVSLDEGGHFELADRNGRCMLIGGAVFICQTSDDAQKEQRRLINYFKSTCESLDCTYPYDLHYNWENGSVVNAGNANKVKARLMSTLPDFLNHTGDWATGKPFGRYVLYGLVGDSNGMQAGAESNLVNDDYAANLYEHMVYRTVENLLFHNPHLDTQNEEIRLDLAKRVVHAGTATRLSGEIQELGLGRRLNPDGTYDNSTFIVTDESSFRTALETAADREGCSAHFDINVRSISYKSENCPDHAFLYLADTLCSFYQDATAESHSAADGMRRLKERIAEHMRVNCWLWMYRPVDREYRTMLDYVNKGDWFNALRRIGEARISHSPDAVVYDDAWFRLIESKIAVQTDPRLLEFALMKLDDYLKSRSGNLDVARGILNILTQQHSRMEHSEQSDMLQFELYKNQMSLANHYGKSDEALKLYEKCIEYSGYTTVEEFLGVQLVLAVALTDAEKYDKALEVAKQAVEYHEMLWDIRNAVVPQKTQIDPSYGRCLSQLGQCLAFTGDYNGAAEKFSQALEKYGNLEKDYAQTLSYLLHAAICAGDTALYEKWAEKYFGTADIVKQLDYLRALPAGRTTDFALLIYVKAMYVLYRSRINKKTAAALTTLAKKRMSLSNHPWELILKYCALIRVVAVPGGDAESAELIKLAVAVGAGNGDSALNRISEEAQAQYEAALANLPEPAEHFTYMYY